MASYEASARKLELPFLENVYEPPDHVPRLDIIFVHGINFEDDPNLPWDTWTEKGVFWPKDLLAADIPEARIFVYGYNSFVNSEISEARIKDHANSLLYKLRYKRRIKQGILRSPIVLVGHSLGGLVIKAALLIAKDNNRYKNILADTRGLVFFACPHKGTDRRAFGSVVARIAEYMSFGQASTGLIESLQSNSFFTIETMERFSHQLADYEIISIVESQRMYLGGRGNEVESGLVVDRNSAILGLPGDRETVLFFDRDHANISRIGTRNGAYEDLLAAIQEMIENVFDDFDIEHNLLEKSNSRPRSRNPPIVSHGETRASKDALNATGPRAEPIDDDALSPPVDDRFGSGSLKPNIENLAQLSLSNTSQHELASQRNDSKTSEQNPTESLTINPQSTEATGSPQPPNTSSNDERQSATVLLENDRWSVESADSDANNKLLRAAKYGHTQVLRILLSEKGAEIEAQSKVKWTALHFAALEGHESVAELLLQEGANIAAETKDGARPLHWAALRGHDHIVKLLLQKGADVSLRMNNGGTALDCAALGKHIPTMQLLLDAGVDITARHLNGQTALHDAALYGNNEVINFLLGRGSRLEETSKEGDTALHYAAYHGHTSALLLLLERGANPSARNNKGYVPLHQAAYSGHQDIIQILLDRGESIEIMDYADVNALYRASVNGKSSTVSFLLDKGANIAAQDSSQHTALHGAALSGHDAVIPILLDRGANIEAKNSVGMTALTKAAVNDHASVVKLLLDRGADIETKDRNGRSALAQAAEKGHAAVVKLLLNRGAAVNAKDDKGWTALHLAAAVGNDLIVELLLDRGADIKARTNKKFGSSGTKADSQIKYAPRPVAYGSTVLHEAAFGGHLSTVKLLVKRGADGAQSDSAGYTPRELIKKYHPEVYAYLLSLKEHWYD